MLNQERLFPTAYVTKKAEHSILSGHPWIYDTEITSPPNCIDGALCDVRSAKGRFLGTGFFNSHSKIRIRLLSRNANDRFDQDFFERRIRYAWEYRKSVLRKEDLTCCRVIFGEADTFPGLTVDRFGDILVTQTLSLGIERIKPLLFPLLVRVLRADGQNIRAIYERNDVAIRELEGLLPEKGFFPIESCAKPEDTKTEIIENGIRYLVDFENGQKN